VGRRSGEPLEGACQTLREKRRQLDLRKRSQTNADLARAANPFRVEQTLEQRKAQSYRL
jgi:hypothetical protein